MKLKALLLGSAAAMFAVSGANAADAVVAEPEAVEYVRVCDAYGSGFFFIPGTETCLRISGEVRVDYHYTDDDRNGLTSIGSWQTRARLNFDARNETDYGTLRSRIRLEGGSGDARGDNNVDIDRAMIILGGLRMGFDDSFFTTNTGYGHPSNNDGFYSFDEAVMLDYTYSANGFSATIGVQDSVGTGFAAGNGSENPDIYAGLSYSASWGRLSGSIISDGFSDDIAWKVAASITVIDGVTFHGWYAGDDGSTRFVTGYVNSGVEAEWGVDVNFQATDSLSVYAGYSAYDGNVAGVGTGALTALGAGAGANLEGHRIVVGAVWSPVPGLSVRPEAAFGEHTYGVTDYDYTQFSLQVVRSF